MKQTRREACHPNAPQRLDGLRRGLIFPVAMAEEPVLALPPREELSSLTDGEACGKVCDYAAHTPSPKPLDENRPWLILRSELESPAPAEDGPRIRRSHTLLPFRGNAAHA